MIILDPTCRMAAASCFTRSCWAVLAAIELVEPVLDRFLSPSTGEFVRVSGNNISGVNLELRYSFIKIHIKYNSLFILNVINVHCSWWTILNKRHKTHNIYFWIRSIFIEQKSLKRTFNTTFEYKIIFWIQGRPQGGGRYNEWLTYFSLASGPQASSSQPIL